MDVPITLRQARRTRTAIDRVNSSNYLWSQVEVGGSQLVMVATYILSLAAQLIMTSSSSQTIIQICIII